MNKKFIVGGMIVAASLLYFTTGTEDTYVAPESNAKEAPKGYVYAGNKLLPVLEVRTVDGTKSFFSKMKRDRAIEDYGFAVDNLISQLNVKEKIISGKQTVRFPDKSNSKEKINLTPVGLNFGLDYSGKSNFDRDKFDGLAYGALSKWLGTDEPSEIAEIFLGEGFSTYDAFIRTIVDFQRQAIITRFKLNEFGFKYQSVSEEYLRLKRDYLEKGELPPKDKVEVFEATVMSNVVSIANFSALLPESKAHRDKAQEIALLLIEYFIYEDTFMLKDLEDEIKFTKPQPKVEKLEKREIREQREMNERKRAIEEAQRQSMSDRRLRGRN